MNTALVKKESLLTIPSLHDQGIAFSAESLFPWLPEGSSTALAHYARQVRALILQTNKSKIKKVDGEWVSTWRPKPAQLQLALIALTSIGVNMNPTLQECCLLSFMDKSQGKHDVVPYVMKNGYQRIASEIWPVSGAATAVALDGDHWLAEKTSERTYWEHREATSGRASKEAAATVLAQMIIGAGGRIDFVGRPRHSHIVSARRMREKMRGNSNATGRYPSDVWKSSPIAMMEKMVLIETYKSLPLRGRPVAAMSLASMADAQQLAPMREQLLMDGAERGLPTDDLEAIDVEPTIEPEVMSDGFEFPEETP